MHSPKSLDRSAASSSAHDSSSSEVVSPQPKQTSERHPARGHQRGISEARGRQSRRVLGA